VWPFVFDAGFTLLRRARRRENLLRAHRSHLYQRLVLSGRSHGTVSLAYAALAGVGLVLGMAALGGRSRAASLAGGLVIAALAAALWGVVVWQERTADASVTTTTS
jgi:hypothetical protein